MITPLKLHAATQERRLQRIHDDVRRVLQVLPDDIAVIGVQTNENEPFGFNVCSASIRRGEETVQVSDALTDALEQELYGDLSSLAWKALMGEDRFGWATIEVPGTPLPGRVGTWIQLDVDLLRVWLSAVGDPDHPRETYAYSAYDIIPAWGTWQHIDASYGDTLTDIISDLPEEVLFGTLGAELSVDGLWDSNERDPHLRVHVTLDDELRLASSVEPARHIVTHDGDGGGDGEYPEIERLIATLITVVNIGNKRIDALMDRFNK